MVLVEILAVEPAPVDRTQLRGFSLDAPRVGPRDVYDFEVAGWVLGQDVPAVGIEAHIEGTIIRRAPLDQIREDVARDYPDAPGGALCGFRTWISLVGVEPGALIQLRAVLTNERRVRLGSVLVEHQPVQSGFTPGLQPLMLTTLGRAGTTWTMRLLSEHPQIVVHRWHPYELRIARYWWHMAKVLTEPRDPHNSAQADRFQTDRLHIGFDPFYPDPISVTPGLHQWMGKRYVEQVTNFAQRMAEETYLEIGKAQGQPAPVYFAEKHRADYLPWFVWELYPRAKEIFLVRDFRDVVSSMLAFNAKKGFQVFGPAHVKSEADFIRFLRNGTIKQLSRSWSKRSDRAILVRYEDLMADPSAVLANILGYLELDASEQIVSGMIDRASTETEDSARHQTTPGGARASIGRWRQALTPELQAVSTDVFADVLEQFGYAR